MKFRKATKADVNNIMEIIKQAQSYLKEKEVDQWQDGYPNIDSINNDIINEYGYVLEKDNNIIGTAAISFQGESTYNKIYEGQWISNNKYAVVHRVAIESSYRGLGISSSLIKRIEDFCSSKGIKSIKIDTHEDNKAMQKLLHKNKFTYCGVIYLEDKSKRLAFEKLI